jgi:nitrite reductase/ring-hydroxylating ferredoxin subunit
MGDRVTIGTLEELQQAGHLTGKAGSQPICVFWCEGAPFAVDDRCPHMGFPLHRGTVESGLLTCHWHNARFDLSSGGTLDPWADDVRAYPVEIANGDVTVVVEAEPDRTGHLFHRLEEGLEQGITLVLAKAVLRLLDNGVSAPEIVRAGVDFGTRYRQGGWGAGLTVLTAMANVLPHLDPADHGLALVHGLDFVSNDTRGRPPRFPLLPLEGALPADRLGHWYRRFVETRAADAAERTLASAVARLDARAVAEIMFAAVTDHVFLDGGHTIDFTNKAFEVLDHLGWEQAADVLPTLVAQTAAATRSEERGSWRYPDDLAGMIVAANAALPERLAAAHDGFDHGPASPSWPGRSWPTIRAKSCRRSTRRSSVAPRSRSAPAPLRTPRRCGSPGSTRRTITATGTRSTTRSPPPTPCTRRPGWRLPPTCCAACTTGRCASTSTGS